MEATAKAQPVPNTKQDKINLEKILWAIKRAEAKREKLKAREKRIRNALEKNDTFLCVLKTNLKKTLASLGNMMDWDPAAFESRTGLKLPE